MESERREMASFEELRDSISDVRLSFEEIDPHRKEAEKFLQQHCHEIIHKAMENEDLWKDAYRILLKNDWRVTYSYPLDTDEWNIRFNISVHQGSVRIDLNAMSRNWAMQRTAAFGKIFAKDVEAGEGRHLYFSVSALAKKLSVQPMSVFEKKRNFDPFGVRDKLGKELDENIIDLIAALNILGLKTSSSCGGHDDHRTPYIHFSGDCLEGVVSLLQAWQAAGGLEYRIIPLGQLVTSIRVEAAKSIPTPNVQADLLKLTDFLNSKMAMSSAKQFSVGTLKNWIGKRLQNWWQGNS